MRKIAPATSFVLALLIAALLLPGSASPRGSGGRPLILGEENTITATRTASIEVEIPRSASYPNTMSETPQLRVEGDGRMIGFALQPVQSRSPSQALRVVRMNACTEPGCRPEVSFAFAIPADAGRNPGREAFLRPGRYRLSLLADGAPVTARLRLRGLRGTAVGQAVEPSDYRIMSAEGAVVAPTADMPAYWSGGAELPGFSGNTMIIGYFQQDADISLGASSSTACHYSQGARPPSGLYLPRCPPAGGSGAVSAMEWTVLAAPPNVNPDRYPLLTYGDAFRGSNFVGFSFARAALATRAFGQFAALHLG